MKPIVTWVLVADGGQARVFENTGSGKGLAPVDGLDFSMPSLQAQDIMADRPGRAYASAGYGRSALAPQTDPVEHREEEFVKSVAHVLDEKKADGAFDRLVIAAAPTALGYIRPALTPQVRKALLAELHKDLTNVPVNDLGKHFESVLSV